VSALAGEEQLVCVTGRFQPVHADHLRLFRAALAGGDRLVVAVTNPDPGACRAEPTSGHRHRADANPFTYFERVGLLAAALAGSDGLGPEPPSLWTLRAEVAAHPATELVGHDHAGNGCCRCDRAETFPHSTCASG